MKNLFYTLTLLCISLCAGAQQIGFTYQAVALDESKAEGFGRDSKGQILLNQALKVRFTIHEHNVEGAVQYQEVHQTATDIFGIFRVVIGSGEKLQGTSLEELRWSDQSYYMQVEVDLGNGFVSMGTEVIVVPPFGLNNTIQLLNLAGTQLSISDGNSVDLSNLLGAVRLSEQEVDAYVANNGYLLTEVDGSVTNELQNLTSNGTAGHLAITQGNELTINVNDADADPTNEIQVLSKSGNDVTLSNGGGTISIADNDNDSQNEIQDLQLSGNQLIITNNPAPTIINLSPYLGNNLAEQDVDNMVGNNGYLITEVDGSVTNEIQDLAITNDVLSITNNPAPTNIDLSSYRNVFEITNNITSNENGNYLNDDFVFGSSTLDHPAEAGHRTRFFFDKSKSSFRAGFTNDDSWNDINRGFYSAAFGFNGRATGTSSFIAGEGNTSSGSSAIALGAGNNSSGSFTLTAGTTNLASGYTSIALGLTNSALGYNSIAMGDISTAIGDYSKVLAHNSTAFSYGETVLGTLATEYTPSGDLTPTDRLFTIGNGQYDYSVQPPFPFTRSDALVMLKNGNTRLHGLFTIDADNVTGAGEEYTLPGQDGAANQVMATDGNGNLNWTTPTTLSETDIDGFVSDNGFLTSEVDGSVTNEIQDLAIANDVLSITNNPAPTNIDLTPYRNVFEITNGVTSNENGNYATDDFVFGSPQLADDGNATHDSRMFFDKSKGAFRAGAVTGTQWNDATVGVSSVAFGANSLASGVGSFAAGSSSSTGQYAFAFGGSTANGDRSFATGNSSALGNSSFAHGSLALAQGYSSIAIGESSTTNNDYSIAIGGYSSTTQGQTIALGYDVSATSHGAIVVGVDASATGNRSRAIGYQVTAAGQLATAIGYLSAANGVGAVALARNSSANGDLSYVFGSSNTSSSYGEIKMGYNSTNQVAISSIAPNSLDRLFVIGNGIDGTTGRSDALVMLKNGNTRLHGLFTIDADNVTGAGGSYTLPGQRGTDGQIMMTDGSGNVSWTTPAAFVEVDGSVTNEIQDLAIANDVLSITNNPAPTTIDLAPYRNVFETTSNVTSNENGNYATDDFVFGSPQLADDGDATHDRRMFFDKSKAAFRAGYVSNSDWDDANIGSGSVAFSSGRATGSESFATGSSLASGQQAVAVGNNNTASGAQSVVLGISSSATAPQSFASGMLNNASNNFAIAMGYGNSASGHASTSIGYQNTSSGSYSVSMGQGNSAGGWFALSVGRSNAASANSSTATGDDTNAIAFAAFSSGSSTTASGLYSFAGGQNSIASNAASVAFGQSTIASGQQSFAMGLSSQAIGNNSFASGAGNYARSFAETSIGLFSTNYGASSTINFIGTDRLFVIGNGTTDLNRSNAFVMLKNGNTRLHGLFTIDADNVTGAGGSYTLPGQRGTDGQIMMTDGSGNVSWTTPAALVEVDGSITNEIQDLAITNDVLTITNNATPTQIDLAPYRNVFETTSNITSNENGDYANDSFIFGSAQLDDDNATTDDNTRMLFEKSTGAFRVGTVTDTRWDAAERGSNSVAMGLGNIARGSSSLSLGQNNLAHSASSVAIGTNNVAEGYNSLALGRNVATTGVHSMALSLYSSSRSYGETTMGIYTTDYVPNSTTNFDANDRLFTIGNGVDDGNRSDALVIFKDGDANFNGQVTIDADNVSGIGQGYTLPGQDGASGQLMLTDGAGHASWSNIINGDLTVAGVFTNPSDSRLKRNITPLNNSLINVTTLKGFNYNWNSHTSQDTLALQTGLIAQEVEKIFPELVKTDEEGFKSVNYIGLVPHLIEAIKELKAENDQLKSETVKTKKTTEERIAAMEARLIKIEAIAEKANR